MIERLKEIDIGLRDILCLNLFQNRILSKAELVELAYLEGYEEMSVLAALDVFLYNGLVEPTPSILSSYSQSDFMVSNSRYYDLKEKGYL